jgi:AraC family transcriptional regulator
MPDQHLFAGLHAPVPHRPDGAAEMARLLDEPPVLQPDILRGDTRLTQRWGHGGLKCDYMRGIAGHIAVGCHKGDHPISWRIENKRFASRTSRTAFTLIPEGHDGHWDIGGPVEVSHVYLTQQRLQACADVVAGGKRAEILVRVGFEDPTSASLLEILSRESVQQSLSARLFVEQAIDLLCTRLVLGHSSIDALPAPAGRLRGLADWQVKRVTSFMRDNLDRQIGLDDLANLVNLSRFHFCTAFRRATGHTPYQWLTTLRIGRARELLADPKLSITDIALAVGYETPSAFAASFRKVTGTSPSDFRRHI